MSSQNDHEAIPQEDSMEDVLREVRALLGDEDAEMSPWAETEPHLTSGEILLLLRRLAKKPTKANLTGEFVHTITCEACGYRLQLAAVLLRGDPHQPDGVIELFDSALCDAANIHLPTNT